MAVSGDLLAANFNPTQSALQPQPVTIAAAATIAPTTRLTFLTGTTQLATITAPVSGYHELVLCFTDASPGAFLTSGNIKTAYTPITNRPIVMYYDPITKKYWVAAVV